jgi:hypothetical protein
MDNSNKTKHQHVRLGHPNQSTSTIRCGVGRCRRTIQTFEPVTVNARYIYRHHRIGPKWFERHPQVAPPI